MRTDLKSAKKTVKSSTFLRYQDLGEYKLLVNTLMKLTLGIDILFLLRRCAFSSNHVVTINQERVSEREEEITDRRNAAPEEA